MTTQASSNVNSDSDARTIYCSNLSEKVTESLLYELFLQVNIDYLLIIKYVDCIDNFFVSNNKKSKRRDQSSEYQYQKRKMVHSGHMVLSHININHPCHLHLQYILVQSYSIVIYE